MRRNGYNTTKATESLTRAFPGEHLDDNLVGIYSVFASILRRVLIKPPLPAVSTVLMSSLTCRQSIERVRGMGRVNALSIGLSFHGTPLKMPERYRSSVLEFLDKRGRIRRTVNFRGWARGAKNVVVPRGEKALRPSEEVRTTMPVSQQGLVSSAVLLNSLISATRSTA